MTTLEDFRRDYAKSEHARLSRRPADGRVENWSRWELQQYLEGRGFAVYDSEDIEDLREAARLDMGQEKIICPICGGRGILDDNFGNEEDCPECDGEGECNG